MDVSIQKVKLIHKLHTNVGSLYVNSINSFVTLNHVIDYRYLRKLENNIKNKARVEGSICNAYLIEEASSFYAHYFEPHVHTRHRKVPRNFTHLDQSE